MANEDQVKTNAGSNTVGNLQPGQTGVLPGNQVGSKQVPASDVPAKNVPASDVPAKDVPAKDDTVVVNDPNVQHDPKSVPQEPVSN